ncbi:hypothetical protein QCD60_25175 [Pokkaliibacter sp. MBI-7]|uniref:hypothetical protein n=1 Tax=Pokkaliibacter sp. MBI-7 TaxID=3040600 RepID=UPI002448383E|nr:hypothetical protein [Pokkaliibacter sp. MBI-7]MDH2435826.1 hypothetical protein [Pokkaliibacter sp. MBI-7]
MTDNQNSSIPEPKRETREIKELIESGPEIDIPDKIRSMKRIWIGDDSVKGLLMRREKGAVFLKKV